MRMRAYESVRIFIPARLSDQGSCKLGKIRKKEEIKNDIQRHISDKIQILKETQSWPGTLINGLYRNYRTTFGKINLDFATNKIVNQERHRLGGLQELTDVYRYRRRMCNRKESRGEQRVGDR